MMMTKTNMDDNVDQSGITEAFSIDVRKICGFCLFFHLIVTHTAIIIVFKLSFFYEAYYFLYKSES